MPIYAYRCAACGHSRDVLQKMSEAPLTVCPVCGAPQFTKQVTAAGFQLKGSGWYATDFRNKGAAPAAAPSVEGDGGKGKDAVAAPAPASGDSGGTGGGESGSGATSASSSSSGSCGGGCACH